MASIRSKSGLHLVKSSAKPSSPYFGAGEPIPESGLYRVFHAEHRTSHEVVLIAGEAFPRCAECKDDVHFELLQSVPWISRDPDFIRVYEIPHPRKDEDQERIA